MMMIYVVVLSRKVTAAEGFYIHKNGIPIFKTTSTSTISTTTTPKKAFDNDLPMPIQVTNIVMNHIQQILQSFVMFWYIQIPFNRQNQRNQLIPN